MNAFRDDNTEGFTAAQLIVMNDEYHHDIALALEGLPDGADREVAGTMSHAAIARRFGANTKTVGCVIARRNWKWL
jgi:hypothetical protein